MIVSFRNAGVIAKCFLMYFGVRDEKNNWKLDFTVLMTGILNCEVRDVA